MTDTNLDWKRGVSRPPPAGRASGKATAVELWEIDRVAISGRTCFWGRHEFGAVQFGHQMDSKHQVRERLRGLLSALSPAQRSARSGAACGRALEADLFPANSMVMLYAPMAEKGEVDLRLLAEGLLARGCRLCVARVDWAKGTMTPARVANLTTELVPDAGAPGRGLLGARADAPEVALGELGVVVVPGLGFDERGNRIGRGAGFYDKFLGGLARGKPVRVALAFDEQVVESVPVEGHDARVDVIVTPTRVIRVSSTGGAG